MIGSPAAPAVTPSAKSVDFAPFLKKFARASGLIAAGVGSLVLLGWLLDVPVLKSVVPGFASMKANTALSFVLAGLAQAALGNRQAQARVGGWIVCLIAGFTLLEHTVGWDLGIDQALFRDSSLAAGRPLAGRMAPATALAFILIGISLVVPVDRVAQAAAVGALFVGLQAVVGFAFGASALYQIGIYNSVALHTAALFVLLGLGGLAARPNTGLTALVASPRMGGVVARRLLPAAIIVPFVIGWIRLLGQQAGLYTTEFGLALYALSNMIVFTVLIIWNAILLNRIDLRRSQIEAALNEKVEELARSNTDLQQFAYAASHDLQEPLRMVASFNQLLARRYQGKLGPEADEYIGFAVDGAVRMQRMIDDLLVYSRVATRGQTFSLCDIDSVVGEAMANLQLAIQECQAGVTRDPLPTIQVDAGQLGQVFQNLVGNAIKFRRIEPPRIHIGASRHGTEWTFSVKDNGIGIDPQHFDRLFVIFQRLHTKAEYAGTGLGLALCKKIVQRHRGRIWVESAPGQGSTFHFTIPDRGGAL